jgi:ATP-dependent helicase/nuclease subunit B
MAAVTPAILSALAYGVKAITPNRRLARQLLRDFDRAQQALGRRTWPTASVLPYTTWLEALWEQRVDSSADTGATALLTTTQSSHLWRSIIDATQTVLLDPAGAATLSVDAWALIHGWGAGGESWRAWRRDDANADDPAIFAAWAEAYSRELQRSSALDAAQLPDILALDALRFNGHKLRAIFVGFIEYTPQQQRLIAALTAAGADIRSVESLPERIPAALRTTAASARDELVAALTWARDLTLKQPDSHIGVVIENMAQRRDEIVLLADELLCPELVLPEQLATRRPYEVSLGTTLSEVPLVLAALGLIALGEGQLSAGDAAALLRSPYLPDADGGRSGRAAIERDWLDSGQCDITLSDAIASAERRSPELAARWEVARGTLRKGPGASPREWADAWRTWLSGSGWPGSLKQDSVEHQAREAWEALLADFVRLGAVAPRLSRADALRTLRALAQERVFQPEGTDARIQVLGVLEGSGLDFDALWVAGLSANRWPPAPAPNPLLPLHWQRARSVPRATAEGELAYARALTSRFAMAAPTVVFSNATLADDLPLAPSALLLDYPERSAPAAAGRTWTHAIADSKRLESVADDRAPPLAAGATAPGGSHIVAAQSDCPFQAVARHRLAVEPWPLASAGLSQQERGMLLHATMAAFWNAMRNQAALAMLDATARAAQIEAAVKLGLAQLPAVRWRVLPAIVCAGEAQRIASLLDAWLPLELIRPAFAVAGTEVKATLELEQLRFRLRIDRVDALIEGGAVIVDYKSGSSERPKQWFDERPRASQLGLYALAQHAAQPETPVRAVAYAQLKPAAMEAVGVAADASAWPGLTELPAFDSFPDWKALESWWCTRLGALAQEIATGWAAVAPRRYPSPCRHCGLQSLCRIDSVQLADDKGRTDE